MSAFTDAELRYLRAERLLARLATVGSDGMPHIAPVGWSYNPVQDTIDVGGHRLERTKKYRDVARTGRAAVVIDDVLAPFRPRGIEVRGSAEAIAGPPPLIRIHPQRIVSWGLDEATRMPGRRNARDVA
jgi:pyridoxamine 5'-phosphate oxidase family protein